MSFIFHMVPPLSGYSFTVSGSNWNLEKLFKIIESSTFAQGNLSRVFFFCFHLFCTRKSVFIQFLDCVASPKGVWVKTT